MPAQLQEILHGILPRCASCKKLKQEDDSAESPEAWQKTGEFLSDHIDVDVSHGLCPDCFEEDYRQLEST